MFNLSVILISFLIRNGLSVEKMHVSKPTPSKSTKLISMRKFIATLCQTIAVLLGKEVRGSELPPCPSDQTKRYHNCFGTFTYANGSKYVGEWRGNKRNGQGTYTFADGNKYVR